MVLPTVYLPSIFSDVTSLVGLINRRDLFFVAKIRALDGQKDGQNSSFCLKK